jgi:hypothetical protein
MRLLITIFGLALIGGCSPQPVQIATSSGANTEPPAATRPQSDPDAIIPVTYKDLDLKSLQPDSKFEDWMLTQRIRDLDGKRVRLTGYMHSGSLSATRNIRQFILLRDSEKDCPFGPGGRAHHATAVTLSKPNASYTAEPITVEGRLHVQPFAAENGNTLYVYVLEAASIGDS